LLDRSLHDVIHGKASDRLMQNLQGKAYVPDGKFAGKSDRRHDRGWWYRAI